MDYLSMPRYRWRADVDNQIGYIYDYVQCAREKKIKLIFKKHESGHDNLLIANNVIPVGLAKRAREFINKIPFDDTGLLLDDISNPPKDCIIKEAVKKDRVLEAYENMVNDPNKWMWERYHQDFWRALPLTLEAFCGSPIFELISKLEEKWRSVVSEPTKKATWVLQRVDKGYQMGAHYDGNGVRKISFIYYLTPDDWDYSVDGGELCVCHDDNVDNYATVNPEFNSMVVWFMNSQRGPLHFVKEVKADKERPRIALVGFFV